MRRAYSLVLCCAGLGACAHPQKPDGRIEELEQRVEALESRLGELETPLEDAAIADPGTLVHDVAFEVGAVELHGGDAIEIASIRGDRPSLEVGGTYEVRGRYRLATRERATLLLGVTTTDAAVDRGAASRRASAVLESGEGEFALLEHLSHPGKPHLTFYAREDGKPFGGVYFGAGEWLLAEKGWSYEPIR